MKKLFLSSSAGYDWNKIKTWNTSAKRTGHDVTNIFINPSQDLLDECNNENIKTVLYNMNLNKPPHNMRFLMQYKYLMSVSDQYDRVILTDSRDVYFHSDPFPRLEELMKKSSKKIICGSESILYKNEHWGNANLAEGFSYVYEEFKEKEICNVGVLCGEIKAVADLCLLIFVMCIHNPASVSDQSSFNILMGTEFGKELIHMSTPSEGFIIQMGTVAEQKFKHNIIDKINISTNKLPEVDGNVFPIIHQYDRFDYMRSLIQ